MAENRYVCPYCGEEIKKEKVLFWETVNTQYTDNIRGEFLKRHGIEVRSGNRFDRMYYKVTDDNVIRVDENGYPTMIRDYLSNALPPEELDKKENDRKDIFDDAFDSAGNEEEQEQREERNEQEQHNIPKRACPFCHCELPLQFGMLKTYHIALFGGRAAGKTAYLINLFQQAKVQLSANNLGTVELAEESKNFLEPLIERYEREKTVPPTPKVPLIPLVCQFKSRSREAFVVFYDIAGEGVFDSAYMANHKGIANCQSLLLMIDPNMFVEGAYYLEWQGNHPQPGEDGYNGELGGDCCMEPLDSFIYNAGTLCNEYSGGIRNVVCVITKLDMMMESDSEYFGSGQIEVLQNAGDKHREAVNLTVLHQVSQELSLYLSKRHKVDLKKKIGDIFGDEVKVNILGVSTSTRRTGTGNTIVFDPDSAQTAPKHRIIEPFLVLLMYFGLIPARKQDGSVAYLKFNDEEEEIITQNPQPEPPKKLSFWERIFGRRSK